MSAVGWCQYGPWRTVSAHLETYADPGPDGLVFRGPRAGVLLDAKIVNDVWRPATRNFRLEHLHFPDLRHTGNTLAAATGASLRELMVRMGHASPKAALRYQHAPRDRDAAICRAVGTGRAISARCHRCEWLRR